VLKEVQEIMRSNGFASFPREKAILMSRKELISIRSEELRFQLEEFNELVDGLSERVGQLCT
jgi:hypothetical protein